MTFPPHIVELARRIAKGESELIGKLAEELDKIGCSKTASLLGDFDVYPSSCADGDGRGQDGSNDQKHRQADAQG